jgi:hypothetical protein
MTISWYCICGENFGSDAKRAFLHRDGSEFHHITPVLLEREVPPVESEKAQGAHA